MNPDQPPASPSIRPPFNPFFTLIHDTATSTTHHPRNVHYIFSDDDPSLLTTACLSALSPPSPTASYPDPSRILLLDLDDSGASVTQAHSLSSSWQIVSTSLTPAPTWDESPSEPHQSLNGGPGFMLKIAGTDGRQMGASQGMGVALGLGKGGGKEEGAVTEVEFQALIGEFEARMKVLRTVAEAGGELGQRDGRGVGRVGGEGEVEAAGERGEEEDTGVGEEM
jgi:hypothetical protein